MKSLKIMTAVVSAFLCMMSLWSCGKTEEEIYSGSESEPAVESEITETVTSEETVTETTETTATTATTAQATTSAVTETATAVNDVSETENNETPEVTTNEEGIYDNSNSGAFTITEDMFEFVTEFPVDYSGVENIPYNSDAPTYDPITYEKLGIKVELSGTNAEMAQQYYDAVSNAYPNLPWDNGGNSVSIDWGNKVDEAWAEAKATSIDEVSAKLDSILSGRDYHELSLEELYSVMGYASVVGRVDIMSYFSEQTHKDFIAGDYTAF